MDKEKVIAVIESLKFYSEIASNKDKSSKLQDEMKSFGIVHDYYHRALSDAEDLLRELKEEL